MLFQPTIKTLLKTWTELYNTFARLAAMVANAGANSCCEELCSRLFTVSQPDKLKVWGFQKYRQTFSRGHPAKRALSAMRKHGG